MRAISSSIENSAPVLYRGRFTGDIWFDRSVRVVLTDSLALCRSDGVGGGGGAARGDVKDSTGTPAGEGRLEERAGGTLGMSKILREVGDSIGSEMLLPLTCGPVGSVTCTDADDADLSSTTLVGAFGVVDPELCPVDVSFLERACFTEFCSESPLFGLSADGRGVESVCGGWDVSSFLRLSTCCGDALLGGSLNGACKVPSTTGDPVVDDFDCELR
jgi:hypothetical protein